MEQHPNGPGASPPEAKPVVSHWHAGYNQPGYLPDADPGVYTTFEAAREALADDMEHHATNEEGGADTHDCDDIPCRTFEDGCPWQRAGAIRVERADLADSEGPDWCGGAAGLAYWITACDDPHCVEVLVARIARHHEPADDSALALLGRCRAVLPGAAEEADEARHAATAAEQSDLELLSAYLAAVGHRGPLTGWPADA